MARVINEAHLHIQRDEREMLGPYRKAGEALIAAKELCGEADWPKWVQDNFWAGRAVAERCMRLAKSDAALDVDAQLRIMFAGGTP